MERKTLIESLLYWMKLKQPCEDCPAQQECMSGEDESDLCVPFLAVKMLESDAEQLQYADDAIQTLLHEQKKTFLKLLPEKFPTDRVYYVPGALEYEDGYNTAINQMIVNVNNWNFERLDGRKE